MLIHRASSHDYFLIKTAYAVRVQYYIYEKKATLYSARPVMRENIARSIGTMMFGAKRIASRIATNR